MFRHTLCRWPCERVGQGRVKLLHKREHRTGTVLKSSLTCTDTQPTEQSAAKHNFASVEDLLWHCSATRHQFECSRDELLQKVERIISQAEQPNQLHSVQCIKALAKFHQVCSSIELITTLASQLGSGGYVAKEAARVQVEYGKDEKPVMQSEAVLLALLKAMATLEDAEQTSPPHSNPMLHLAQKLLMHMQQHGYHPSDPHAFAVTLSREDKLQILDDLR